MCGIVGHLKIAESINPQLFDQMRDTLQHRGPDGSGTQILNNNKIALGHRRLSIIDLSNFGKQPMCNEDATIWLTFNGEIYNFEKIRTELQEKGHIFISKTDSEVLVHGYEEWGVEELLSKLNGMFAFAIWDQKEQKLVAARDRFGIKPFYFYHDSKQFIFASELKAIIMEPSVKREVDFSSVSDFLVYRFIPSPKSIYENIKKLPPAHYLIYDFANSTYKTVKYWKLESKNERLNSYSEIVEKCEALLMTSIKEHLVSDVPIGIFLSGGYDSSSIVHYMSKLGYPVKSFTIGFENWGESEHEYARIISEKYFTSHYERILPPTLGSHISDLVYYYD